MAKMNLELEKELSERGWTTFLFDGDLLDLASGFGTPVSARVGGSLLDLLQIKLPQEAHPNSLSARFGKLNQRERKSVNSEL
jgi:hypothetical protein